MSEKRIEFFSDIFLVLYYLKDYSQVRIIGFD